MQIRPLDSALSGDLHQLEVQCFSDPWSARMFAEALASPAVRGWGLWVDDQLCGYVLLLRAADMAELLNIAMAPTHRRRGYARALMHQVDTECQQHSIQQLWLEVRASNHAAQALYQQFGFVAISRRPRYYRDNQEDAIVMCRRS